MTAGHGPRSARPERLRILQVAAPSAAGGMERVVQALAIGGRRRGHDVAVAVLLIGGAERRPFLETLRAADVRVHPIRVGARSYRRERREVVALAAAFAPDVVHTHGIRVDVVDGRAFPKRGVPVVTTVHGPSRATWLRRAVFEPLQRWNYRQFDAVVTVSSALRRATLASGVRPERLHMIPNAWCDAHPPLPRADARGALGLPPERPVVGWVGRFVDVKGPDLFLHALSRLAPPRPLGVMIGYGPLVEPMRALARRLGLDGSVRFLTEIGDAGRYFGAFDVFVLSSRSEGLPIVLLESMAAGAPVVATRVGGVPEALGEGDARLVPPEDAPALARAIGDVLADPRAAAGRAASAARRLRARFDLETFLGSYEEVYRGVLRARR